MTATVPRRTSSSATPASHPATSYYLLVFATAILLSVGLGAVLSSSSFDSIDANNGNPYAIFLVQLAAMVIGLICLMIGSRLAIRTWKLAAPWVLFSSIGLLVLVVFTGESSGGNRNWIRVGMVTMQPSEIAKLGLALYLGVVLATFRNELTSIHRILVPGGLMAALVIGLVLVGKDMGTALVLVLLTAAAYWVAGLPARFFVLGGGLALVAVVALINAADSRTARILAWMSDDCDIQDECLQTTHGTWALASGGLWGLGPGMSREKWGHLPEADNDFIFGVVGEEYGLLGTLLVLVAYGLIVVAVMRIVQRHADPFVQITAGAIGAWLAGQASINIAVVVGLAPVTGIPLPLVSSGGSSLIMSLVGIGVLMSFARREPGAREAFAARPSVIRRSLAVMSRGSRD
jgi:cell division protein FtsW